MESKEMSANEVKHPILEFGNSIDSISQSLDV